MHSRQHRKRDKPEQRGICEHLDPTSKIQLQIILELIWYELFIEKIAHPLELIADTCIYEIKERIYAESRKDFEDCNISSFKCMTCHQSGQELANDHIIKLSDVSVFTNHQPLLVEFPMGNIEIYTNKL